MRIAGSASWLFEEAGSQMLDVALYTRDAANLAVTSAPDIPPSLDGDDVARRSEVVPTHLRDLAATQWTAWWRQLLDQAAHEAIQGSTSRRREVFDPPDFQSLADMPPLRSAVTATYPEGRKWFRGRQADEPPGDHYGVEPESTTSTGFSQAAVRSAAEDAAAKRGEAPGEIRAVVYVLDVAGLWSFVVAPGCALCSAAVAGSPDAGGRFLRQVFDLSTP